MSVKSSEVNYKGYIGSVHFSEDDDTFYGKLEAINDLIMFEGESVRELRKAFHEAVDDYIQACKETRDCQPGASLIIGARDGELVCCLRQFFQIACS